MSFEVQGCYDIGSVMDHYDQLTRPVIARGIRELENYINQVLADRDVINITVDQALAHYKNNGNSFASCNFEATLQRVMTRQAKQMIAPEVEKINQAMQTVVDTDLKKAMSQMIAIEHGIKNKSVSAKDVQPCIDLFNDKLEPYLKELLKTEYDRTHIALGIFSNCLLS